VDARAVGVFARRSLLAKHRKPLQRRGNHYGRRNGIQRKRLGGLARTGKRVCRRRPQGYGSRRRKVSEFHKDRYEKEKLTENSNNPVIKKIYNLEPITDVDLHILENVLWNELGSQEEYQATTNIGNLAAFVRSLIGLSQEAVNEKFGEYLNDNVFNSQQQEFIQTIINYARENGDVELIDIANTEPFINYDYIDMFNGNLEVVKSVVGILHNSVIVNVA